MASSSPSSSTIPLGGGTSNNPAPSSKAFALHQRSANTSANSNNTSVIEEGQSRNSYSNYHNNSSSSTNNSGLNNTITPSQYISRLTDISQMDVQSALDQMKSLLIPSQTQRVFKLSFYRKQTKGHYARDDPAFVTLQISFLVLISVAYSIAFINYRGFWSTFFFFLFHSIVINYILVGFILATVGQMIANQYLIQNSDNDTSGGGNNENGYNYVMKRDTIEWMFAFDIHCNAFFPFFIIVYVIQYFILPIVLDQSFFAFFLSNTIYTVAFGYYFYITHLGYRSLSHLNHTEWFLAPIVLVVFVFVLNFVGYPFGLGWNASRIMAHLYFEA